jgi:hypothetical protein
MEFTTKPRPYLIIEMIDINTHTQTSLDPKIL